MPLLEVSELSISIGEKILVNKISFSLKKGEKLGLIGESGSGKSLSCLAILGLLPSNAKVTGSIKYQGKELLKKSEAQYRKLRGNKIGIVFQEPQTALDPLQRIDKQITASLASHGKLAKAELKQVAERLALSVGLPAGVIRRYPHELSGGQRQRVLIAMALSTKPGLLLADEPTTALDATVQAKILNLITELIEQNGSSLLLVTHDMGVAINTCDRIIVMHQGNLVESGTPKELIESASEPYTQRLIDAAYATSWQEYSVESNDTKKLAEVTR